MSPFSILGKLPESYSPAGHLNDVDFKKIARLAVVTFVGAFAASLMQIPDLPAAATTWQQFGMVIVAAAQAGLAAVGSAAVEAIRRYLTNQIG